MPTLCHRFVRRPLAVAASGFLLLGTLLGCADRDAVTGPTETAPAATPPSATDSRSHLVGALLQCQPLPAASAKAVIGPDGGVLHVGPHTFTVPAGALADTVTITANVPSSSVNEVEFGPAGLHFAPERPARLSLSYANCSLVAQLLPKRIAYVSHELGILELLPSVDDLVRKRVSADIEHFSRYAVAW